MDDRISFSAKLNKEENAMLDDLVKQDTALTGVSMDRSKVVKRLIRQEYNRRKSEGFIVSELPAPEGANAPILVGIRSKGDTDEFPVGA